MSRIFLGLPTYNGATNLRAAIESLRSQTFQDWSLLLSDNGSTDETPSICQEFAALDARIRWHRHATNRGSWANFMYVLAQCDSPYFAWFPDDYTVDTHFLEVCVARLDADPQVALATTNNVYVDAADRPVLLDCEASKVLRHGDRGRPLVHAALLAQEMPILIYSVFRADVLRRAVAPYVRRKRHFSAWDCVVVLWVLSRFAVAVDPVPRRTLLYIDAWSKRTMTYYYLGFGFGFGLVFFWRMLGALPWRHKPAGLIILGARWWIGALYKTLDYAVRSGGSGVARKLGAILHSLDGRRSRVFDERLK
jgi:glycosyltransferase involved in cell wall biosynthesis